MSYSAKAAEPERYEFELLKPVLQPAALRPSADLCCKVQARHLI